MKKSYEVFEAPERGKPVKAWVRGVDVDPKALTQLHNIASLPFIHRWVAAMPDVHLGKGATVGSVIATKGAIIPAAVGVDIGCGMSAARTSLKASDLPDSLRSIRSSMEAAVPHGRTRHGGSGDKGAWRDVPKANQKAWKALSFDFADIVRKHPKVEKANHVTHLGTLGTGNHFIELCLDEEDRVWFMLHSGSRGVGNRIATIFIEKAKKDMEHALGNLPSKDLAYLTEGTQHFADYVEAVLWAQEFARINRQVMMEAVIAAVGGLPGFKRFKADAMVVNCHHNYAEREVHFGEEVYVTRKGAVRAQKNDYGIIPGSMGAKSFIVKGKGAAEAFCSCSHGAGRQMSRTKAKKAFTLDDLVQQTAGVECRKDAGVLDEIPGAYKPIEQVMANQADLVEVVATLKQVMCVKG